MLLREVDKKLGLTKSLSKVIPDDRDARYTDHSVEHMLRQRVYAIAAGYEDVDDHHALRNDQFFQAMIGKETSLASTSTLSRFENTINRRSLIEMSKQCVEHFIAKHKTPPKELILDFDPTNHEIYGKQEQHSYHGYYKHYCFLPLHVFCGPHLLVSFLRPSNIDNAKYSAAILKLLVKRLREVWPDVSIIFRGDCAFSRKKILHWCDHNNVQFIVGLAGNARLKNKTKNILETAKKQYELTHEKQRLFSDFEYAAKSWKRSR